MFQRARGERGRGRCVSPGIASVRRARSSRGQRYPATRRDQRARPFTNLSARSRSGGVLWRGLRANKRKPEQVNGRPPAVPVAQDFRPAVRSPVQMALKTRVWSAGKILLLVVALGATYTLFAAAAMRLALRTREVQVPDLTNRTA